MMGIDAPRETQGRSMLPLLTGQTDQSRETTFTEMNGTGLGIVMARTDRYKFCYNWNPRQIDELYDMREDPLELENLADDPEHAETVERLRQRIIDWMREMDHPLLPMAAAALDEEPRRPLNIRPEVTTCELLEDDRLRFGYRWHCDDEVEPDTRGFVQFIHPEFGEEGCGSISFRIVSWPETPTEQWRPGEVYSMPTDEVEIPAWTGEGTYDVRIGLYTPEKREGPPLKGGRRNWLVVGTLTIERDEGGDVTAATFEPAE
jgi:hypothetical protein